MSGTEDWERALKEAGQLTGPVVARILEVHGERGQRAVEAVGERRVKGYRDFTVVVGYGDEYVVEGRSCTCEDSRYNLDPEDPSALCWHAIAAIVAERVDAVDEHDMWYSEVREFL